MGLETATYISGLNPANPVGATDPKSAGDDHLRLIKTTLLNTFPAITGAVSASHVELSLLTGTVGVTGTGALVRANAPTFVGTVIAGTFQGAHQGSGALLTALDAAQLASGIIPNARFPATLPAASGANLTALNATNLASGTVADARQGANVALINAARTITGAWSFTARPKVTGAGGMLAHANAANTGGAVIITNVVPTNVSGMNPGDLKLVY